MYVATGNSKFIESYTTLLSIVISVSHPVCTIFDIFDATKKLSKIVHIKKRKNIIS